MKTFLLACILFFNALLANSQNFQWAKHWGGTEDVKVNSIFTDNAGNVYTTGYFRGKVDFDPGIGIDTISSTPGYANVFVSKLNSNGDLIWVKAFIGSGGDQEGRSVKVDTYGNVLISGVFFHTVDFDPNAGVFNLTAYGSSDIFIAKLDSLGNFNWAKHFGTIGAYEQAFAIALDSNNSIYATGYFTGTVDFDPNIGIHNVSSIGSDDAYILKLDQNANFIWVKNLGGVGSIIQPSSLVLDQSGSIITTGKFTGNIDFDPGSASYNLYSSGVFTYDMFISKLDSNGNFMWAKQIGSVNEDRGNSVVVTKSGHILTTGTFDGTVDFDPGIGIFNLSGVADVFVLNLDNNGNFSWAKKFGGIYDDEGNAIALDSLGNIYTSGKFSETVDFDPGPGIFSMTSSTNFGVGFFDVYISKLDSMGNFIWATGMGDGYNDVAFAMCFDNTNSLLTTGNFYGTVDFDPSINTYNISTSMNGFDKIFVLKLGFCAPQSSSTTQNVCNSYLFNGQTYTASGIYTQTFTTAAACDSIVSLNLTINTVNTNVTVSSPTLSAAAIGATYQWLQCPSNTPISGATSQSFSSLISGSYAVIVTENGCTDTSNCYTVITTDLHDIQYKLNLSATPNPSKGIINLSIKEGINYSNKNKNIYIYNTLGQIVFNATLNSNQENVSIDISNQANGIFFIEMNDGMQSARIKVFKE